MTGIDRSTERRVAWLQYTIVALTGTVLLFFAVDDKGLYAVMVPLLLLIAGYRTWTVERLSPRQADFYAHAVVGGAADRMLDELRSDRWLHDLWAAAPLSRLLVLPPERIGAAMTALRAAGPPSRPMSTGTRAADRGAAVLLGGVLGGALGWAAGRAGPYLTWSVAVALVLVVVFRVVVAAHNRRQLARMTARMRADPRAELAGLLAPPWENLRTAVTQELHRLATADSLPRRMPDLRVTELLMAGGMAAGFLATWSS
ncbi:hypothetical protein [Actinoplanes couchii]|uniref:Integral membrane protein n=1 Tax=Actinoplanes couchii TaxID=403638 RepID=A0ABQ3WZI4_9ACTN|nr:hypothetical protein [Actinoplanes couchii]MDR6316074.1 hypothetical protein [Actinoplanes couchii]GID51688.1 hypothetical protein Aco03nite_000920 [Actinoplanes couchii]